jgi:hypothetical protein
MIILRIYPMTETKKTYGVRVLPIGELNQAWEAILRNLGDLSNEHCTPLYLSQQEEKSFLSIIYDVQDTDSLGDIIVKHIPATLRPEKTRAVTLLKPVFFPAPKDRPANLERYQVAVRAKTSQLENVFIHMLQLGYPNDVFPTYAAYSFGEDDILTSMLSTSRDRIEKFMEENVRSQTGVTHVEISRINMSKRLAPATIWKDYRESRYYFRPTERYEEFDFTELAALTGAFVHEIGID